jgi:hypothetical protein
MSTASSAVVSTSPYVRKDGKLVPASWSKRSRDRGGECRRERHAIAGDLVDCETMYAAKALLKRAGLGSARRAPDRPRL